MELFLAAPSWPFSGAVIVLVVIGIVEALALLAGQGGVAWLDQLLPDAVPGVDGLPDAWLGWLHIGKVPMLVLLVLLLGAFAVIGYAVNGLVSGLLGIYPPTLLSVVIALLGALPVVRVSGAAIARIIPRDESSAVLLETLVGRVAVIVNGTARPNYPAEARVKNEHGQTLYVRVEPDGEGLPLVAGDSVLLVKQISGTRFLAIANPRPDLL